MVEIKKEIVLMSPDELIPYHTNMLDHPEDQVDRLASIIADSGFDVPIVVDKNKVIIKGHGRQLAAKKLGLEKVSVIVRDDLTPNQVKAMRISDNAIAYKSSINEENLSFELEFLRDEDFDMTLTGYDSSEIDLWLKEEEDKGDEEEEEGSNQLIEQSHTQEINPENYEFEHKCPKCGFEF
jgi:ParB-like chromosome segregation protein Spo0J